MIPLTQPRVDSIVVPPKETDPEPLQTCSTTTHQAPSSGAISTQSSPRTGEMQEDSLTQESFSEDNGRRPRSSGNRPARRSGGANVQRWEPLRLPR
jgi:hypothetical protein